MIIQYFLCENSHFSSCYFRFNLFLLFSFSVDLLQMLEFNVSVRFPAASLFTVILALCGELLLILFVPLFFPMDILSSSYSPMTLFSNLIRLWRLLNMLPNSRKQYHKALLISRDSNNNNNNIKTTPKKY